MLLYKYGLGNGMTFNEWPKDILSGLFCMRFYYYYNTLHVYRTLSDFIPLSSIKITNIHNSLVIVCLLLFEKIWAVIISIFSIVLKLGDTQHKPYIQICAFRFNNNRPIFGTRDWVSLTSTATCQTKTLLNQNKNGYEMIMWG